MPHIFIFAEQVRQILRSGKKEIEISEGARISASAADLIKENGIQIKTVASGAKKAVKPAPSTEPSVKVQSASRPMAPPPAMPETQLLDTQRPADSEISNEDLEALVKRVIERFKQLKGIEPISSEQRRRPADQPQRATADDDDLIICRCEEITKGEIKAAIRNGMQTLNGIKRITRAGMGLCQGQTCQRLVIQILAQELGVSAADIDPTTARGPVRPLRLEVFANS